MELEFIQVSDCGRVRDHNEDYLGCVQPDASDREQGGGWLFALADGVGGQDLGEVASRTAVETLLSGFRGAARGEQLRALLPRLVQKANAKVFETGLAGPPRRLLHGHHPGLLAPCASIAPWSRMWAIRAAI